MSGKLWNITKMRVPFEINDIDNHGYLQKLKKPGKVFEFILPLDP